MPAQLLPVIFREDFGEANEVRRQDVGVEAGAVGRVYRPTELIAHRSQLHKRQNHQINITPWLACNANQVCLLYGSRYL